VDIASGQQGRVDVPHDRQGPGAAEHP
jgi:hypothetical protein